MDPPPLSAAPPISTTTTPVAQPPHISYPNSVDSSPRSRTTDSWDELPGGGPPTLTTKLRLMCSYGGHIIPRPHDKTLCYIGGDTRIIVVDRHTTLSDLHNRLSKTLMNNNPFTLKYQLPNEDLDSLISVTTDEDFENMIDEYDRIFTTSGLKMTSGGVDSKSNDLNKASPSRLRLFLFPLKSDTLPSSALSIESLLESSTKSEDWFLDALNGNMRQSTMFSSDSSSVNCLLDLEDNGKDSLSLKDDKNQSSIGNNNGNNCVNSNNVQDVHSVPDSPMLETTSSFGSTSSSPSMANLPPIRVHVDESGQGQKAGGGLGIEEQFQQMSVGVGVGASPPPPVMGPVITGVPAVVGGGEYVNRVFSDDERSEQGLPVGYRKVPQVQPQVQVQQQQLQPPIQLQQKHSGAFDLPSPDSVSSEGSGTNPLSRQRQMAYQEQIMQIQSANNRVSANLVDPKTSDLNNKVQMQQLVQESEYVMPGQFDQHPQLHQQQQFVHAGVQYIHPHSAGTVPIASYYPVYPSQQHHAHHPALEQPYVYYVPARPPQAYNMPVQQQSYSESPTATPSSRPQTPPPPTMVNPSAAYNPGLNVPASKPEMSPGVYRTSATGAPHLVQVHSSQHQPQFIGYSAMHHPSQSVPQSSGATANYAYEYADPTHAQIYYTQAIAPQLAAQYQTLTPAPGMVLSGTSSQVPAENIKPQSCNSQP